MSVVVRIENLSKAFRLGVLNRRVFIEDWKRKFTGKGVAAPPNCDLGWMIGADRVTGNPPFW